MVERCKTRLPRSGFVHLANISRLYDIEISWKYPGSLHFSIRPLNGDVGSETTSVANSRYLASILDSGMDVIYAGYLKWVPLTSVQSAVLSYRDGEYAQWTGCKWKIPNLPFRNIYRCIHFAIILPITHITAITTPI